MAHSITFNPTATADDERFIVQVDGKEIGRVATYLDGDDLLAEWKAQTLDLEVPAALLAQDEEMTAAIEHLNAIPNIVDLWQQSYLEAA